MLSFDYKLLVIFPTKFLTFSSLGKTKISKNGLNVWFTYTQTAFSSAIKEKLTKALRGKLKNIFSFSNPDLSVPRHMSNKIGKFFPRKRARAQIEAAIRKPLHKLRKDLCHCTQSRLYGCRKLSKLAGSHFLKEYLHFKLIMKILRIRSNYSREKLSFPNL